mgnify:CR=1 FL=1
MPPLLSIIIGIGTDESVIMVSMGNTIGVTMVMTYSLATPVC